MFSFPQTMLLNIALKFNLFHDSLLNFASLVDI